MAEIIKIVLLGFIALVLATSIFTAGDWKPCEEYKNWQIRFVPARCVSDYLTPQEFIN